MKTRSGRRRRFQPPQRANKSTRASAPEGHSTPTASEIPSASAVSASIPNIEQGINNPMQAILAPSARSKSERAVPPAPAENPPKSNNYTAIQRRKRSAVSGFLLDCPCRHLKTVSNQDDQWNVSACFHATNAAHLRLRTFSRRAPVETPMGLRMAKPHPKTVPWASAESRRPSLVAENYPRQAHNRKIDKRRG